MDMPETDTSAPYIKQEQSQLLYDRESETESSSRRARLTFVDITGTRHADVTISLYLTAEQAIERLISANFLSSDLQEGEVYTLLIKRNGKLLSPNETLKQARVSDGDIVIVGIMTKGGGGPIAIELPDEIAKHQLKELKEKLDSGIPIASSDLDKIQKQITRVESYLSPRVPLIIPDPQNLAVRLVKADLLAVIEDYRSDQNRWFATAWAFIGAVLGVIVNWITASQINVTGPSLVVLGTFALIAVLSWIAARDYGKRAERLKSDLLIDSGTIKNQE
jgi:hypothetical protein